MRSSLPRTRGSPKAGYPSWPRWRHSEERIACAWPISNIGAIGSALGSNSGIRGEPDEETQFKTAYSGLPRSTTTPRPDAVCVYCRDEMIDAVGLLDGDVHVLRLCHSRLGDSAP